MVVNDVSEIMSHVKSNLKDKFSEQLTASSCNELIKPLNCIINVAHLVKMYFMTHKWVKDNQGRHEQRKQLQHIESLLSSAKFMELMLCSQISCAKLGMSDLQLNFRNLASPLHEFISNNIEPFLIHARTH